MKLPAMVLCFVAMSFTARLWLRIGLRHSQATAKDARFTPNNT
jgi:hypothetical protein